MTTEVRSLSPAQADALRLARKRGRRRRLPLLPALVYLIITTQLPFLAAIVVSFMRWQALYPDRRGALRPGGPGAVPGRQGLHLGLLPVRAGLKM